MYFICIHVLTIIKICRVCLSVCLSKSKSKSKSKCVYIYSGNSMTLVLGSRRWGADSTSTSFPLIPAAHSCSWPGKKFSAPILHGPMDGVHAARM